MIQNVQPDPHLLPPQQLLKIHKPQQFGVKNKHNPHDERLKFLNHSYFFQKNILDIGCSQGNLDLQLTIRYFPQSFLGIDLSQYLINYANNTLKKYCQDQEQMEKKKTQIPIDHKKITNNIRVIFPHKQDLLSILHELPDSIIYKSDQKPNSRNQQQYVMKNIELDLDVLKEVKAQNNCLQFLSYQVMNFFNLPKQRMFDTILCFSVAKSIHLTFGDEVLKLFFQKIYGHLVPSGTLILQVQEFKSYKKDIKQSQITKINFQRMTLKPQKYVSFLQSLGFKMKERILHKEHLALRKSILILVKQ